MLQASVGEHHICYDKSGCSISSFTSVLSKEEPLPETLQTFSGLEEEMYKHSCLWIILIIQSSPILI